MNLEEAREYFGHDRYAVDVTGIKIEDVGENYSKVSLVMEDKHLGAKYHFMGAVSYTMADFAFAVATNTPDSFTMTMSSTISYLNQPKDPHITAECKCIKNGRRTCLFETRVTDGVGTLLAIVTTNGLHVE